MTVGRDPRRDGSVRAIARALGVTRVARLTGLDRTGVEVASAIRPLGHVLQVTNGKGARFEDAAAGALMEAAELFAAERAVAEAWDSAAALARRVGGSAVLSPRALDAFAAEPAWDEIRLAWRSGVELFSGRAVHVPACAVHVPPAGAAQLGPALVRWTSNGMGAAPSKDAALLHALLELVERDRLARSLPDGFTEGEVRRRMLDRLTLRRTARRAAELAGKIEERGFRVYLFDVSGAMSTAIEGTAVHPEPFDFGAERASAQGRLRAPAHPERSGGEAPAESKGAGAAARSRRTSTSTPTPTQTPTPTSTSTSIRNLGLPCAAALIVDHEHGPVPVAAGYACRLGRDAALVAALLEAAQSRATEIHGAREDVALGDRRAAHALRELCARATARRDARRMPDVRAASPRGALGAVLSRLQRAGARRAVAVHLEGPPGVAVVKVLVPGLLLSELL